MHALEYSLLKSHLPWHSMTSAEVPKCRMTRIMWSIPSYHCPSNLRWCSGWLYFELAKHNSFDLRQGYDWQLLNITNEDRLLLVPASLQQMTFVTIWQSSVRHHIIIRKIERVFGKFTRHDLSDWQIISILTTIILMLE